MIELATRRLSKGMSAESAATLCGKPRRQGAGWMCKCPAHDDRNPSLKIDNRDSGGLLVHCFAGCDQIDVINGLKVLGAWPECKR